MKRWTLILFGALTFSSFGQSSVEAIELGMDGYFGASTVGGAFGVGPKVGFRMNENFILGPTFRYQRNWSSIYYPSSSYNNFGGGLFIHGRYKNTVFGGFEAEVIRNNFIPNQTAVFKKFVPTVFICAGFSREFNGIVRLNIGLYYDIINSLNSPYRGSYLLSTKDAATGNIVKQYPLIYRLSFYFTLWNKPERIEKEEVEETW
jgi:hypothetical protein